jgi:ABC-2 type transport system ATP-binding protein
MHESMESLSQRYYEVHAVGGAVQAAQALDPISERAILGGKAFIFEDADRASLQALGDVHTPSISDLFVAKMEQGEH